MDSKAVKFLLKLLSFPNYRARLSQVKPTQKMKAAERNKICRKLWDMQLVTCSEEIKTLTISPKGKYLLNIEETQDSLTPEELQVLQASAQGKITPERTGLKTHKRMQTIDNLVSRDLLILQKEVKEVWLSERGKFFLVHEYDANSMSGNLPFKMLAAYLQLIRDFHRRPAIVDPKHSLKYFEPDKSNNPPTLDILQTIRDLDVHLGKFDHPPNKTPSDRDILQTIHQLDKDLKTDSCLPIFHLRQKLESSLSRKDLDAALSRLQEQKDIKLKSLEELLHYSPEYFDAAIAQDNGWSLFFIVLNS